MSVLTIVAAGLLGALGLTAVALILGKAASTPVAIVAESTDLSKAESEEIFPRWLSTLYLGIYVPLTVIQIVVTKSVISAGGQWQLFIGMLVVCLVQVSRCRKIMSHEARGSKLFRQAQLIFWLSAIGASGCLSPLALMLFAL